MSEWRSLTLGDICKEAGGGIQTGPFGSQLHAADYVTDGTPSVMPQNIGDNRIIPDGIARVSSTDMERLRRHRLEVGDIVYSRRGDVERRALVREENAGWLCGTGCLRVRIEDQFIHDSSFVSYALGLEDSRAWIVRHAVGATMLNLNTSILTAVPLRVPKIAKQQAISEVLGALDDKIGANSVAGCTALEIADAVYLRSVKSVTVDPLTFESVAEIGGGGTPSTSVDRFWNGPINWATPTDVTRLNAPYLYSTARTITEDGLSACSSSLYPASSILMTSRATIGAFAMAQVPVAVNQGFIVVNAKDRDFQWWLFHDMRSRVDEFLTYANGATFLELPRGRFKALSVRLPAVEAAREFNEVVGPLHALAAALMQENQRLAATRDDLLPLLMSGKVRVRDAERVAEDVL